MTTSSAGDTNILGVYISGYHITTLIVDLETRSAHRSSYQRKAINSWGTATEIINSCAAAIKEAINSSSTSVTQIGLAMPGPFDYDQGISYIHNNKKHEALYGLNVKQLLAQALNMPEGNICMLNDAAAFLKGEVFAGGAKGYTQVIGITMGTGLGTARLIDGVAEDANLWNAPFLDSIAEDYLSERWFLKRYYALSGINVMNVKELASFYGSSSTVKAVFKEFAANLANFTANFLTATNAQVVVLSGDISQSADCFLSAYKTQLTKTGHDVPVVVSKLNTEAILIGAATCWLK